MVIANFINEYNTIAGDKKIIHVIKNKNGNLKKINLWCKVDLTKLTSCFEYKTKKNKQPQSNSNSRKKKFLNSFT